MVPADSRQRHRSYRRGTREGESERAVIAVHQALRPLCRLAPSSAIYSAGRRKRPQYVLVHILQRDIEASRYVRRMLLSSGPGQCGPQALCSFKFLARSTVDLDHIPHEPAGIPSPQAAPFRLRWWGHALSLSIGNAQLTASTAPVDRQAICTKAGSVQFHRLSVTEIGT